jgi:hypothetical protein
MSKSPPNSKSPRQIVLADPSTNPVLNDRTISVIDTYLSQESAVILKMLSEDPDDKATNIFQMISIYQILNFSMEKPLLILLESTSNR